MANQSRVNCLFDMIGQSDMLSFNGTEEKMLRAQRSLGDDEYKMSFSFGGSAESFVASLLSDQFSQPEGTINIS